MHVSAQAAGRRRTLAEQLGWIAELPRRIRASEYLVVGESARFRALQRRRTRLAARIGFLVIAAAAATADGSRIQNASSEIHVTGVTST